MALADSGGRNLGRRRILIPILATGVAVLVVTSVYLIWGSPLPPPQLKVKTFDPSLGLELDIAVNSTKLSYGNAILISVDLVNDLNKSNNVPAASDWLYANFTLSAACGTYDLPFGIAVLRGYYQVGNFSSGTALSIFAPPNPNSNSTARTSLGCPVNIPQVSRYVFEPSSDLATRDNSSAIPMSFATTIRGYWVATQGFQPLPPGNYTAVCGDEWGKTALIHFRIG